MLVKILGLIDIGVAIMIALTEMGVPVGRFYLLFMLAHAIKAVLFIKDILSLLDLLIVCYTIVLIFWGNTMISLVVVIFLFLKGIYSFA
jgi:hypothetical protein